MLRWVGLGQWGRSRPGRFDLNEPIAKKVEVRNTLCRASWADMVRRGNLAPLQDKDQEKDPTQLLKMCKGVQRICFGKSKSECPGRVGSTQGRIASGTADRQHGKGMMMETAEEDSQGTESVDGQKKTKN